MRKKVTPFKAHVRRAIKVCGSQTRLAERAGISQQAISRLLYTAQSVTGEVAVALERATDGLVQRRELRPDLFGDVQ
jgi:DNA-binding transcriptional regulator YdaS (Cro superfamily)